MFYFFRLKTLAQILLLIGIFIAVFYPAKAQAISLIRDAEIEDFLQEISDPILKAADLNPKEINLYIVNDASLNAFVAGGQNIFINTGLIRKYDDPAVLIGVIAHEAGHIKAGHLARGGENWQKNSNAALVGYIAGAIAAAAAGPDAGMALILGSSQIAQRNALKFSRTQEEAADALAVEYLQKSNNSSNGLLQLLQFFNHQQTGFEGKIDEYALTHPISKKRVAFFKNKKITTIKNNKKQQILRNKLKRIIAKLEGFLDNSAKTLNKYSRQQNDNATYAKIIANYKIGKIKKSIHMLDGMIAKMPKDNYLLDLKGQILFESGDISGSIKSYQKAITLNKNNILARIALADAIIALDSQDAKIIDAAIKNLLTAQKTERTNAKIYQSLAKAYGQKKQMGKSYLALAENHLLRGKKKKAKKFAKLAEENLNKHSKVELLKAQDIQKYADDE